MPSLSGDDVRIKISTQGDTRGIDETNKGLSHLGGMLESTGRLAVNMGKVAAVAIAAAGAAAVAFGVVSIKAYAQAEKAQAALEHAVIAVSKATKEQLKQTEDLADVLEKKGVLDGDNIKLGLAQLSTFGLSNAAVQRLGGSLADLAVNQHGVNATGEQLSETANMIAKALNGQFGVLEKSGIRFSDAQKNMILFGTEMQKVDAINQGFAQNLKYTNEVALNTFEGKMAKMKVNFENLQEAVGKALVTALTPFIDKITAWAISDEGEATIQNIADAVANMATNMTTWATDVAIPWSQTHWPAIKKSIDEVKGSVKDLGSFLDALRVIARTVGDLIWGIANGIAQFIYTTQQLVGYIGKLFVNAAGGVSYLSGEVGKLIDKISNAYNKLNNLLSFGGNAKKKTGNGIADWWNSLPLFATGTNSASGGMAVVGERGPELVELPRGAKVNNNTTTQRMMSSGTQGQVTYQIQTVNLHGADAVKQFFDITDRDSQYLNMGLAPMGAM